MAEFALIKIQDNVLGQTGRKGEDDLIFRYLSKKITLAFQDVR